MTGPTEVTVATFHALGLRILRENAAAAGLAPGFAVADDAQRAAALAAAGDAAEAYTKLLREQNLVDLDELVDAAGRACCARDPELVEEYRARWRWVFVDEYQDVDATQYELLRLLVPADGNICAIGDPDQAIYSFRGADVGLLPAVRRATSRDGRTGAPDPQLPVGGADHRGGLAGHRADLAGARAGGWSRPGWTRTRALLGLHTAATAVGRGRVGGRHHRRASSAACRTGPSTPAGSTPGSASTMECPSPTWPCSTVRTRRPRRSSRR